VLVPIHFTSSADPDKRSRDAQNHNHSASTSHLPLLILWGGQALGVVGDFGD
jgi:hypothetical protein